MRYWFHSESEEAFALEVPPPDGADITEIDEATYKEIVAAHPADVAQAAKAVRSYTMEDLARQSIKWSDEIKDLEAQIEAIKAKQKKLHDVLDGQMQRLKADKLETAGGVIVRSEQTHVNAADWSAIWQFVEENDRWDFLQKRLTTTEILKWRAANDGRLPPGMNLYTDYKLSVKKPAGRKALPVDTEGAN